MYVATCMFVNYYIFALDPVCIIPTNFGTFMDHTIMEKKPKLFTLHRAFLRNLRFCLLHVSKPTPLVSTNHVNWQVEQRRPFDTTRHHFRRHPHCNHQLDRMYHPPQNRWNHRIGHL